MSNTTCLLFVFVILLLLSEPLSLSSNIAQIWIWCVFVLYTYKRVSCVVLPLPCWFEEENIHANSRCMWRLPCFFPSLCSSNACRKKIMFSDCKRWWSITLSNSYAINNANTYKMLTPVVTVNWKTYYKFKTHDRESTPSFLQQKKKKKKKSMSWISHVYSVITWLSCNSVVELAKACGQAKMLNPSGWRHGCQYNSIKRCLWNVL